MSDYTMHINMDADKKNILTQEELELLINGDATPEQKAAIREKMPASGTLTIKLKEMSEKMKNLLDSIFTEENYRQAIEAIDILESQEQLSAEDISDVEDFRNFIDAYERYKQKRDETNFPRVTAKAVKDIDYPLDKINSTVFTLLQEADAGGQLRFAVEKTGSKKPADLIFSINFDELEKEISISRKLTAFDKRVYISVSALYNTGNAIISISQIYAAMGNAGRPSARDIGKINDSLTKMAGAVIHLDNISERRLYPKYSSFNYDGHLLPMERITGYINNQLTEGAIHLFREPPLTTFAKERKQITTVNRLLLESPISKTDANLLIDDYLIERIARIKKGKSSNRILYETIFKYTKITSRMQKKRGKDKIAKYLTHYKKYGFIKNFTEESDGVTIIY